jgi:hypothetical protein
VNADVLRNLTDPAVLFFFLGVAIGLIRSNLEVPAPVAKFLSLYLLMALGFKGGQALGDAGLSGDGVKVIGAALLLALVIPAIWFMVLRKRVNAFDAAAIAATYGSVSAVTFVTASQFLANRDVEAGGYLTVALVLMESPAIIMAVLLATWVRSRAPVDGGVGVAESGAAEPVSITSVLHEALTDGANLLLMGSLVIGYVSGPAGGDAMKVFTGDIFKGMLAFFLLEMGLLVARQLREVRDVGPFLVGFAIALPLFNATVAILVGSALGFQAGDVAMLAVLASSGSYIVVPAVVRFAIPEARPSRYLTMALAVTFPFNIILGIPLYFAVAERLAG